MRHKIGAIQENKREKSVPPTLAICSESLRQSTLSILNELHAYLSNEKLINGKRVSDSTEKSLMFYDRVYFNRPLKKHV